MEIIEFGKEKNIEIYGIAIDKDLKFDKHVNKIYSKADRKLNDISTM